MADKNSLFSGFGGVALADILANSVAMMIILIVITLMVKQEQEAQRLEKIDEVSILLSRELATSVVMNKLPTSPPVRLHDYNTSPIDRNPQFHLMPIIELHKNHIRDYYHGERISYKELLRQNNAFDRYLDRLNELQLRRMRIDIYNVRLFYIVMSILKTRGVWPGHWHFMESGGEREDKEHKKREKGEEKPERKKPEPNKERDGEEPGYAGKAAENDLAQDQGAAEAAGDLLMDAGATPEGASLSISELGAQKAYPYDDLAFQQPGGQAAAEQQPLDLGGAPSRQTEKQKTSDQVFASLSELFAERRQNGQAQSKPRKMRFRNATPADQDESEMSDGGTGMPGMPEPLPFDQIIAALFAFMNDAQKEADEGRFDVLENYDFRKKVAPYLGAPIEPRLLSVIQLLSQASRETVEDGKEPILVMRKKISAEKAIPREENNFIVQVNARLQALHLQQTESQRQPEGVPGETLVTTRLSLYPEIYRGVQVNLNKNSFVLMHPDQKRPHEYRWRIVTYVEPDLGNFITAFVYAAVKNDQLILSNEENGVKTNHALLLTQHEVLPARHERWLLMLYSLAALFVVFGLMSRLRS